MPAWKVYYTLLSQIKLFELKKRTNIRRYAQEKIVTLSGYITTLKNKQKLDVSSEGRPFVKS
jgi:hypothetical protein